MNKAEFKEKRKKLLEQRVRPTEGTEAVSAWDYDFNDSNEVLQSGEVELLENMTSIVPEDRPKTGEIFKEKRNKTRHKLDFRYTMIKSAIPLKISTTRPCGRVVTWRIM